ncbi:GntR family frlABCD operon transcriptional regulator [Thermosporothrix hazakensis]|jgi:GntR family frlABCD operon transcriptional regulator|uniref:GntR family frlABCD operon transcriptional regulator n=2 Tax=Thermosporothrix TaxID=768650 RepID=A0A326U604_THEHA|nr:GntR family transcriptional regulator [Thermosporothrix hazakensis]PZW29381.1 GntR family frlABCD operon transcriptional regulator [Thermosporothrix hazakensis]BBH85666.1 putative HTH-type transcriptional regulator YurK [Thermosporothrix sp. COM3]GCE45905.1 putative HTH-type transcriptional regulator YurK [Thermosporothrix hazakensis]
MAPLYVQIRQLLQEDIQNGRYKPEERLPTEAELCEMYNVSRITIRKAISDLVDDGTLTRKPGKGTFVTSRKIRNELLSVSGFADFSAELGKKSGSRIISSQIVPATEADARTLRIAAGDPLLRLVRLLYVDDRPLFLDIAFYPLQHFPGLEQKIGEGVSTYHVLHDVYGVDIESNEKVIDVVFARKEEADLLGCDAGSTLFKIEKVAYDAHDRPVHTSTFMCETNKVSLTVQRAYKKHE